jgi:CRP/FNR family transcriptional regulator
MQIHHSLKQFKFLQGISDKSLLMLSEICVERSLKKKVILFLEGDEGFAIYFCISGNIQLFKTSNDGREIVIKVIQPGEIFGEVILFEESKYPVSAMALIEAKIFKIPKYDFFQLLKREDFRNDFIGMLMAKQRYLTNQIKYLTTYDVEDRLLNFFKQQFGDQKEFICRMSKKDVAAAISSTPETLSRLLLRLKKERKMFWEGKKIVIRF